MRLIDIIEITNENIDLEVYGTDGELIAKYDGRNSIPKILNNREVLGIDAEDKTLQVLMDD